MSLNLPPMPWQIERLPRDDRGYPVPWFVAYIDGKPDFRVVRPGRLVQAVAKGVCWICGDSLAGDSTFVLGPMCTITRTTAEPPNHRECAEFAAKACPFLSIRAAKRRQANLPVGAIPAAGVSIDRNPGCVALWHSPGQRYEVMPDGNGLLFRVPAQPSEVTWFAEGRPATRQEVLDSINSGHDALFAAAGCLGDTEAEKEFALLRNHAQQFFPTI